MSDGNLRLGDTAPDFEADTTQGRIKFHDFIGDQWAVLFSHPADYTPVCTTELGMVGKLQPEFARRNVKTIALSVDPLDSHTGWVKDIEETQQAKVDFPIIADADRAISKAYGMIAPASDAGKLTVRSVFIIDPAKKIRLVITYPASTGRNFDEILRVIDSLQLTSNRGVATPANWKHGDDVVILPSISNEDAASKFPGFKTIKPYLRTINLQ